MEGPYRLINSFHAHDGPVRSIAVGPNGEILTGSQSDSPCLRRWNPSSTDSIEEIGTPIYHDHWVTSITSLLPNSTRVVHPNGCIITGCMDFKIRVYNNEAILMSTLCGHEKGIISFSWTVSGLLLSGSWDGTCRIWDLTSNTCVQTLGPHENGVHVLGLSNGLVATTSTGESVNGKPDNFKLRIWDPTTGTVTAGPFTDHSGSIRAIAPLPVVDGFMTAANDGSVALRSIDGETLGVVQHSPQEDGSAPFILDCCALYHENDGGAMDLVSCGEDGSVMVWRGMEAIQSIPHPTSVWCVLALPPHVGGADGDFVTAGHDGVLRFFSKNADKISASTTAAQLTEDFLTEVEEAQRKKRKGPSAEDLAKAPLWELRGQNAGTSENQVMVFNRDGTMIAAQWNSGSWIVIGEVTGTGDGGYIGDTWYDHVMPVEIETPTGLRSLKLGHNQNENPFVAAQRFIEANSLGQNYLGQIADWVSSHSGQTVPTIGVTTPAVNTPAVNARTQQHSAASSSVSFSNRVTGYTTLEDIPVASKLFAKVTEFNAAHQQNVQLNEREMELVNGTLTTLCDTSHYHSSILSVDQVKALEKMSILWDAATTFPAFDILRLVAVHPAGADVLAGILNRSGTTGKSSLSTALHLLTSKTVGLVPNATLITVSKYLCNLFKNVSLRNHLISSRSSALLEALSVLSHVNNKTVRLSAASIAMNLAVVVNSTPAHFGELKGLSLLKACCALITAEKESSEVILRSLRALGTTLFNLSTAERTSLARDIDIRTVLNRLAAEWSAERLGDPALQCLQEILKMFPR